MGLEGRFKKIKEPIRLTQEDIDRTGMILEDKSGNWYVFALYNERYVFRREREGDHYIYVMELARRIESE